MKDERYSSERFIASMDLEYNRKIYKQINDYLRENKNQKMNFVLDFFRKTS